MEYDFFLSAEGQYEASFSLEQEAFTQWFNQELGTDKNKIIDLLNIITQIRKKDLQHHQIQGQFHLMTLNRDEVTLQDQGLPVDAKLYAKPTHSADQDDLPDYTENDGELEQNDDQNRLSEEALICGCGLDDFEYALNAWLKFISE
ncbi:YacL family protein [Gayadomonas joobiniege]|uniref:UPF0231 family protein n=1 Tax=Gayadomonas joobiniege TaxID=1234606 RepID=UPI0004744896|nr:YacL family protein [Gayadomonas joobiniege]